MGPKLIAPDLAFGGLPPQPAAGVHRGLPPQLAAGGNATQQLQVATAGGLDVGFARSISTEFDGRLVSYGDYRGRLVLYQRLCVRRGLDCEAEGALMLLQNLPAKTWEATKKSASCKLRPPEALT